MSEYKWLILAVDINFIKNVPYWVSIPRHIKFKPVETVKNQMSATLMVNKFECLRGEIADLVAYFNIASA